MNTRHLRQSDMILSKCGRPTPPPGSSVVYWPWGIQLQAVVDPATTTTITREVTGDTIFCIRSISATVSPDVALYIQVQLPNGRFLINSLQSLAQMAGYGSYRYLFGRELACPPGTKIQVTLDTSTPEAASAQPAVLLFGGGLAFRLNAAGERRPVSLEEYVSSLPRILDTTGQNILAPCWISGEGPRTPDSFEDHRFIYSSPVVSIPLAGPSLVGSAQIQLEQSSDFLCRRLLVDVSADDTVTAGSVLMRARLASGYQLMDDYIDAARYIGSTPFAHDWHCGAGDAIIFDYLLVDGAGSGSVNVQVHADGVRRRWRAGVAA